MNTAPLAEILGITAAGASGVLARYGILLTLSNAGTAQPIPTFIINLIGSAIAGFLWGRGLLSVSVGIGFLGGFTTFSAYAVDTLRLWNEGRWIAGILYAVGSPSVGIAFAALGAWWAKS